MVCCVDYECSLSREEINALLDDATRTWNLTDETLELYGIQAIVNCTEEGDTVSLKTTTTVKPPERIVIPWKLAITGSTDDNTDMPGWRWSVSAEVSTDTSNKA